MNRVNILIVLFLTACATTQSTPPAPAPAPVVPTTRLEGFIPVEWTESTGKLKMEIPRFNEELIWQVSLASGVGSNPIGLDRSQLGATHIIRFERVGSRVLMVEPNYAYRALSDDPSERRAVEQSFATSILAGFEIESLTANGAIVDATEFFLSDAHGVTRRLRDAQQGSYTLDRNRSALYIPRTKAFPRNTEVEATLTFTTSDRPGALVNGVTPTPEFVTVREHHSFVALPEPGFTPRRQDPRVGVLGIEFYDYASPFTEPITKRWISRHRLEAGKPIVYYVDNGVPEPIRTALVEGASWWSEAFAAAGFPNGFQVKVLPADADPLDIRYNVVNWVHRSTRGWSYGASVVDPRSGEIIKGTVLLGSLRIRQDVLLARGLMPQYDALDPATSPALMALARIRQLSAHEVGHTIGLHHNMAASTYGRASVMDYPAPWVKVVDGRLDLSEAYSTGVGAYDIAAIKYAYQPVASEAELDALAKATPLFVNDPHSRSVSGAHPLGSVWDNGADPVAALRHEIEVRRIALAQFGLRNIADGQPLSSLEEALLPLYLHHRYQLEAAAKSIGGVFFTYAVRTGDTTWPTLIRETVPVDRQRDALAAVISTLEPSFLEIPKHIVDLLAPASYDRGANTELFPRYTDPMFDPLAAAMTSADITVAALLDPARNARLAQQAQNLSQRDVLNALVDIADGSGSISRATRTLIMTRMSQLAANRDTAPEVRSEASDALRRLSALMVCTRCDPVESAHRRATRDDIERFLTRPGEAWQMPVMPAIPPGPPI